MEIVRRMWLDDSGQDLAEYAMLVALIALVVIAGVRIFGTAMRDWWNNLLPSLTT